MSALRYLLITDGPTDKALVYILDWLLSTVAPDLEVVSNWLNPDSLPKKTNQLVYRIEWGLQLYANIDVLFIHRDAENQPPSWRYQEIDEAIKGLQPEKISLPFVCVVPVRMTEAWLLIDENALRIAANNPNGRIALEMPSVNRLEDREDPKQDLYDLLEKASGLKGRRLQKFRASQQASRVAELIDDFSPLLMLPAFDRLKTDLAHFLQQFAAK